MCLCHDSGSRVDVVRTRVMSVAALTKCSVCGFDFAGCGESGGEHVRFKYFPNFLILL